MSIFICKQEDCDNFDVVYNFGEDSPESAECGGCHAILKPEEN